MTLDNNTQAFLALVRGGLWETNVQLLPYGDVDFKEVYRLAQEQSVVGLVAAGLEHVNDVKIPKEDALTFVGETLQLEQRNTAMNIFIGELVDRMRQAGIYTLLVKGQGVAQCYERPLWRACGDVDFFLDEENYVKAKRFYYDLAQGAIVVNDKRKHVEISIDNWIVELHGNLRGSVLKRIDSWIDIIQYNIFSNNRKRVWKNDTTDVYLPAVNEDSILIFVHLLQHFVQGGVGLRQICDWCRLLWFFKDKMDSDILERYICEMGIMTEWKTFGALAVGYLGASEMTIPFFSNDSQWVRKSRRLLTFILKTGNMGHNRDMSYYERHTYVVSKLMSLGWHTKDAIEHFLIFPVDSIRIWTRTFINGIKRL